MSYAKIFDNPPKINVTYSKELPVIISGNVIVTGSLKVVPNANYSVKIPSLDTSFVE